MILLHYLPVYHITAAIRIYYRLFICCKSANSLQAYQICATETCKQVWEISITCLQFWTGNVSSIKIKTIAPTLYERGAIFYLNLDAISFTHYYWHTEPFPYHFEIDDFQSWKSDVGGSHREVPKKLKLSSETRLIKLTGNLPDNWLS